MVRHMNDGKHLRAVTLGTLALLPALLHVATTMAGPVQVSGHAKEALMECLGFGHDESDIVFHEGGPIPGLKSFGGEHDGFRLAADFDERREAAYFDFQSMDDSTNEWSYYLTGYTNDPAIKCGASVLGRVCKEAKEMYEDWVQESVDAITDGNPAEVVPPPQFDPVKDCVSPE